MSESKKKYDKFIHLLNFIHLIINKRVYMTHSLEIKLFVFYTTRDDNNYLCKI